MNNRDLTLDLFQNIVACSSLVQLRSTNRFNRVNTQATDSRPRRNW